MKPQILNGDEALAFGALVSGVSMVTSYPGSPSSGTVECLIPLARKHGFYLEWSSNERVALEMAIGASIAGQRALVCTKSVGMNVMLDPLMALTLTPVNGGLVILLGDDPGGYGSQNDQDTRPLAPMLEMPMLEPATPAEAYEMMREAFELSERLNTAVIIRETRSFTQQRGSVTVVNQIFQRNAPEYKREPLRYVPVPKNVVQKHRDLHERLTALASWADSMPFNPMSGRGKKGILGAGFAFQKLLDVVGQPSEQQLSLLKLGILYPLPEETPVDFLKNCGEVLVFEENEPYVETEVKAIAHDHSCSTRVFGKLSKHVSREGELFRWQIQEAIHRFLPEFVPAGNYRKENEEQERPQKEGYCAECRYDDVLDLLENTAADLGQKLILVGDPGCLVTIADRLDAKYGIGSAVAVADGMNKAGMRERPVAMVGDSGFFHSTLPAICNAVHNNSKVVVVVLDNGTTLTSGRQPHPGVGQNALGEIAPNLSIPEISRACGIKHIHTVCLDESESTLKRCFREALRVAELVMLIVEIPDQNQLTEGGRFGGMK